MDIDVERNAYGRQIDSRVAHIDPDAGFRQRARAPAIWKRSSSARPSSAASGRALTFWPAMRATRCWWNRAGTWSRHFIRN